MTSEHWTEVEHFLLGYRRRKWGKISLKTELLVRCEEKMDVETIDGYDTTIQRNNKLKNYLKSLTVNS